MNPLAKLDKIKGASCKQVSKEKLIEFIEHNFKYIQDTASRGYLSLSFLEEKISLTRITNWINLYNSKKLKTVLIHYLYFGVEHLETKIPIYKFHEKNKDVMIANGITVNDLSEGFQLINQIAKNSLLYEFLNARADFDLTSIDEEVFNLKVYNTRVDISDIDALISNQYIESAPAFNDYLRQPYSNQSVVKSEVDTQSIDELVFVLNNYATVIGESESGYIFSINDSGSQFRVTFV